jgi:signal transduction histidine kinase
MHIVKHIIERHGGTIAVHSQPGKGTEIIVNLPLGG